MTFAKTQKLYLSIVRVQKQGENHRKRILRLDAYVIAVELRDRTVNMSASLRTLIAFQFEWYIVLIRN